MSQYETMNAEQLKEELEKAKALLLDAEDERGFIAMQSGQHINATVFTRIDRDIEKYQNQITEIEALLK